MSENPIEASELLCKLVFAALNHGVEIVREGDSLVPFIVTQKGDERRVVMLVADNTVEAIAEGRSLIDDLATRLDAYALVMDSYITIGDQKFDAILAEVEERGSGFALQFAQRYGRFDGNTKLETIGNVAYLGKLESKLA